LSPRSPVAFNARGALHLALRKYYAANRDLSYTVKLNAKFSPSYLTRARVYLAQDRFAEAVQDLTQALEFEPNSAPLRMARARANHAAKDFESALADYNALLEAEPGSTMALSGRGKTRVSLAQFEEAMADFAAALRIDQRNVQAYVERARGHLEMGNPALALPDLDRAFSLDSQNVAALVVRARASEVLGQPEEAVAYYKRARERDVANDEVRTALARLTGERFEQERVISDAPVDGWQVIATRQGQYFARSNQVRDVRVPLEVFGEAAPRILSWTVRDGRLAGMGLLEFSAGNAPNASGEAAMVKAALIDTRAPKLITIMPVKHGTRETKIDWRDDDGAVQVAALDGISDTFQVRKPKRVAPVAVARTGDRRRRNRRRSQDPVGDLFGSFWQRDTRARRQRQYRRRGQQRRRRRPQNFLQFLFR